MKWNLKNEWTAAGGQQTAPTNHQWNQFTFLFKRKVDWLNWLDLFGEWGAALFISSTIIQFKQKSLFDWLICWNEMKEKGSPLQTASEPRQFNTTIQELFCFIGCSSRLLHGLTALIPHFSSRNGMARSPRYYRRNQPIVFHNSKQSFSLLQTTGIFLL